jgi:hypothetical protein
MPTKANAGSVPSDESRSVRLAELDQVTPIAGVPGPGPWLIAEFEPTALFSLKISLATSSVGRTLVVPTPYAIKMALVDAAFRAGFADTECGLLLKNLVRVEVRIAPTDRAVVTHTFVKVRQESRDPNAASPYGSTIAYREIAHLQGVLRWAFDLASGNDLLARQMIQLLPLICYIGKRGSFVRFVRSYRARYLASEFTQPIIRTDTWAPPARAHIAPLDDFGPDAEMAVLSSYSKGKPKRDRHRRFVDTIIPLGIVNSGPGFTQYGNK